MTWKPIPFGPYRLEHDGLLIVKAPRKDKKAKKQFIADAEETIVWLQRLEELTPFYLGDLWGDLKARYPEDYTQVLDHLTQREGTLDNYQWVAESIPKSKRRFREGVGFAHHQTVAALPAIDRDRILKKAVNESLTLAEVRLELRLLKRRKIAEGAGELTGKHRVLYADPPWAFDDQGRMPSGARSTTADHYASLPINELVGMGESIRAHCRKNSVLFMWVPVPLLLQNPGPREVLEAWGFTYKSKIVWSKVRHNMGHYVSNRHEDLLICTRGSCGPDRLVPMVNNVQVVKAEGEHSEKPKEFRKIIERLYDGPYLELFARHKAKGWKCWGDQVGVLAAA
jgi:N6-adenosine-specific RNA methylase IME4